MRAGLPALPETLGALSDLEDPVLRVVSSPDAAVPPEGVDAAEAALRADEGPGRGSNVWGTESRAGRGALGAPRAPEPGRLCAGAGACAACGPGAGSGWQPAERSASPLRQLASSTPIDCRPRRCLALHRLASKASACGTAHSYFHMWALVACE